MHRQPPAREDFRHHHSLAWWAPATASNVNGSRVTQLNVTTDGINILDNYINETPERPDQPQDRPVESPIEKMFASIRASCAQATASPMSALRWWPSTGVTGRGSRPFATGIDSAFHFHPNLTGD